MSDFVWVVFVDFVLINECFNEDIREMVGMWD